MRKNNIRRSAPDCSALTSMFTLRFDVLSEIYMQQVIKVTVSVTNHMTLTSTLIHDW